MINIGAYKEGSNPKIDTAIRLNDDINSFLKQGTHEVAVYEETVRNMEMIGSAAK